MNIILIGNGFDLAHGLKTSYNDFVTHVFDSIISGDTEFRYLMEIEDSIKSIGQLKESNYTRCSFRNDFFAIIARISISQDWCDIEKIYFQELKKLTSDPKSFNDQFYLVQKALTTYIGKYCQLNSASQKYATFFKDFDDYVILNFNYTLNFKHYIPNEVRIYNLHGEIGNPENPIIFGYAADEEETQLLIDLDNNHFLTNIKDVRYKHSNVYDRFTMFLNDENYSHDVWILGHSCGISDKLILRQIFESENIKKIHLCYYNQQDFFNKQINIKRISLKRTTSEKIINFPSSLQMPQVKDNYES